MIVRDKEIIMAEMEEAAVRARNDLYQLADGNPANAEGIQLVADWWRRHWMSAGHTRLGRILVRGR